MTFDGWLLNQAFLWNVTMSFLRCRCASNSFLLERVSSRFPESHTDYLRLLANLVRNSISVEKFVAEFALTVHRWCSYQQITVRFGASGALHKLSAQALCFTLLPKFIVKSESFIFNLFFRQKIGWSCCAELEALKQIDFRFEAASFFI